MATHAQTAPIARQQQPLSAYWHLLSLDAPTVAALWCYAFALAAGEHLPLAIPLALAIATWMLYVCDRLLDARERGPSRRHLLPDGELPDRELPDGDLKDRHWFHAQHQTAFIVGLVIAALSLGWLVRTALPFALLRAAAGLASLVALYFLFIHGKVLSHRARSYSALKELAVGAIFSTAVALPAATRTPHPAALLIPATLFAALCWLNCTAIEHWEAASHNRNSDGLIPRAASLLAFASLICALFPATTTAQIYSPRAFTLPGLSVLELCIAAASLSLSALNHRRDSLSPLRLRVAADAVLLTPLLVLPFLH